MPRGLVRRIPVPITFKQAMFIVRLCDERGLDLPDYKSFTKYEASDFIEWCLQR